MQLELGPLASRSRVLPPCQLDKPKFQEMPRTPPGEGRQGRQGQSGKHVEGKVRELSPGHQERFQVL